jgi:hypothetical protein
MKIKHFFKVNAKKLDFAIVTKYDTFDTIQKK